MRQMLDQLQLNKRLKLQEIRSNCDFLLQGEKRDVAGEGLRRIFWLKGEQVRGGWKKLKDFHNLKTYTVSLG